MPLPRRSLIFVIVPVAGTAHFAQKARIRYVTTRALDVSDDCGGIKALDLYRWLESIDSKKVGESTAASAYVERFAPRSGPLRPEVVLSVEDFLGCAPGGRICQNPVPEVPRS